MSLTEEEEEGMAIVISGRLLYPWRSDPRLFPSTQRRRWKKQWKTPQKRRRRELALQGAGNSREWRKGADDSPTKT